MRRCFQTFSFFVLIVSHLIISGVFATLVFASITDGTIDSADKYAWSENIGWINFGTIEGNVHITDSALTGYAWAENAGWISLNCSNTSSCATVDYKVANNGEGNLSGHAWGENVGWIVFNPSGGGVTIDASGNFAGYAWGENTGWIVFNCSTISSCSGVDYKVSTNWQPASSRSGGGGDSGGGGGGGLPASAYNPSNPPEGGFKIIINSGTAYSETREVLLTFSVGDNTEKMMIANNPDFILSTSGQIAYQSSYAWDLCYLQKECSEGIYNVYAKLCTQWGRCSEIVSGSIVYRKKVTVPERITEIVDIIKKIPEIFKPKPPETKPEEIAIEELLPKETPLAFQGKWQLLPPKPIKEFVLSPLPIEIRTLAKKFPELGETLKKLGITKITDIEKLKKVTFTLPGLTERVGLATTKIELGKFALPQGIPVAKLSLEAKKQIPSEIVFARTGGELIDFNITLTVSEKGNPQQKITTISGKPLQLVVKPGKPVTSIKGYVVFKSKKPQPTSFQFHFNYLAASLIFVNPVFAQTQDKPIRVEERLVLLEFEYTDTDGDGIYTAEIQAPFIEGEYEIITVMDFEDPELGKKEIRLTTVVDPEGYIFERNGNKETRIPGAIVSIYWLNRGSKQYELWPAKEYQQENPQITNATGKYSFLVPEGSYYLKVEASGYLMYDGKPFQVKEGSGVHINMELKTKYWWLKVADWKTILLILVLILLFYNFYRDKIREKIIKKF